MSIFPMVYIAIAVCNRDRMNECVIQCVVIVDKYMMSSINVNKLWQQYICGIGILYDYVVLITSRKSMFNNSLVIVIISQIIDNCN